MTAPDVSVVVAVFNAMPYLNEALASLERQTIGMERMQIVLVDDGSTDSGPEVVAGFAARHGEQVVTHHQENSGTPAVPFNRGLDRATGRYVFFLGADDYLADDALEKLVAAADRWQSDVVVGKVTGVDGRSVNQRLFDLGTMADVDPFDSPLPYNLNNVKLFRREMVERHRLRFPEQLRSHCDQPFTFAAIMHARRVSLLADQTYYFGVKRADEGNVTYTTSVSQSLHSASVILETFAEHLAAGPRRDFYVRRRFEWELAALLNPAFLDLAPQDQQDVLAGVRDLTASYLNDQVLAVLPVHKRVRLALAREGQHDLLREVIAFTRRVKDDAEPVGFVVRDAQVYAAYPGFDHASTRPEWYAVGRENISGRLARVITTEQVRSRGAEMVIRLAVLVGGLDDAMVSAHLFAVDDPDLVHRATSKSLDVTVPVTTTVRPRGDRVTEVTITVTSDQAVAATLSSLRLRLSLGSRDYDLPVPADGSSTTMRIGGLLSRRRAHVAGNVDDRLVVTADPDQSQVPKH